MSELKAVRTKARGPLDTSSLKTSGSQSRQSTLVCLAIIKSHLDAGKDCLDLMKPFVLHVLNSCNLELINEKAVSAQLYSTLGLKIPVNTIEVILGRIVRGGGLLRVNGIYERTVKLERVNLEARAASAKINIAALVTGLIEFARELGHNMGSESEAIEVICEFLSEFALSSLQVILRGTAIPGTGSSKVAHYLVGAYINSIRRANPERFESLSILVQGHMLANALVCPGLVRAPRSFNKVTFYIDTPLLMRALGLEGRHSRDAALELFGQLAFLGGKLATFEHLRDDLENAIRGAVEDWGRVAARGGIVRGASRNSLTRSDLRLAAASLDHLLESIGVEVLPAPPYVNDFQIDEATFGAILNDAVHHFNTARDNDIRSVQSIYALRRGQSPISLERAKAILVTSNEAFARAAFLYGKSHEESRRVSSVTTDLSLANIAWLKLPMNAPNLSTEDFISIVYSALRPTEELLNSFLFESEKLHSGGVVSERTLQILRSDVATNDSLMQFTVGDSKALACETALESLEEQLDKERSIEGERELLIESQKSEITQAKVSATDQALEMISQSAWKRSQFRGCVTAWLFSIAASFTIGAGIFLDGYLKFGLTIVTCVLAAATLLNLVFGLTVVQLHRRVKSLAVIWFWGREQLQANCQLLERREVKDREFGGL